MNPSSMNLTRKSVGNPDTPAIVYYVSGHGFGHATRSGEVIRAIRRLDPDVPIQIRSWADPDIFRQMGCDDEIVRRQFDIGVVQSDGITMNIPETLVRAEAILNEADGAIDAEAEAMRRIRAGCIVGDIPPVAHRIAEHVDIPSLTVTNFTWDWIYDGWRDQFPAAGVLVDRMQLDYGRSDLLLRLPYAGILPAFRASEDVPMLGRRGRMPVAETRRLLGLNDESRPVVLFSFGGMGLKNGDFPMLREIRDIRFVSTFPVGNDIVTVLPDIHSRGVEYSDLVRAVDAVITKPGYGIVSECAVNHTRMLYTDRGSFREYDAIMKSMEFWNCAQYIAREKLLEGNCGHDIRRLMDMDPAAVPGAVEAAKARGADVVAARILDFYRLGRIAG